MLRWGQVRPRLSRKVVVVFAALLAVFLVQLLTFLPCGAYSLAIGIGLPFFRAVLWLLTRLIRAESSGRLKLIQRKEHHETKKTETQRHDITSKNETPVTEGEESEGTDPSFDLHCLFALRLC